MKQRILDADKIQIDGILRMIEAMLHYTLDRASISNAFRKKKHTKRILKDKRKLVLEIRDWVNSENWSIWMNIYCTERGKDERRIRKNFRKVITNSLRYLTREMNKSYQQRVLDKKKAI